MGPAKRKLGGRELHHIQFTPLRGLGRAWSGAEDSGVHGHRPLAICPPSSRRKETGGSASITHTLLQHGCACVVKTKLCVL